MYSFFFGSGIICEDCSENNIHLNGCSCHINSPCAYYSELKYEEHPFTNTIDYINKLFNLGIKLEFIHEKFYLSYKNELLEIYNNDSITDFYKFYGKIRNIRF